jgi:NTE family protein
VLASCAIPGYFRPVTIDGVEYMDGGVHSATNADVLRNEELDVVVIVSSLSAIVRLEQAGTAVISLEPGAEARRVMGLKAMAEDRGPGVIAAAYDETRQRILDTPSLAALGESLPTATAG